MEKKTNKEPETATKTAPQKKFKETEPIACMSVTVGGLYMEGAKSGDLYSWLDIGDVVDVEYRDVMAELRKRSRFIFRPFFVVQDEDFLSEHPELSEFYGSLYTPEDIEAILRMPASKMKATIETLPEGVKEAVKGLAMTMIDDGRLDSVSAIKVIDEIFGTEMLLKLANL